MLSSASMRVRGRHRSIHWPTSISAKAWCVVGPRIVRTSHAPVAREREAQAGPGWRTVRCLGPSAPARRVAATALQQTRLRECEAAKQRERRQADLHLSSRLHHCQHVAQPADLDRLTPAYDNDDDNDNGRSSSLTACSRVSASRPARTCKVPQHTPFLLAVLAAPLIQVLP